MIGFRVSRDRRCATFVYALKLKREAVRSDDRTRCGTAIAAALARARADGIDVGAARERTLRSTETQYNANTSRR